ncbi:hypothetical protein GDO81_015983 [Engystomops pustulosus]|uniref:Leptin receptor n=1 Tax=Engystomops pustulosus TaxID=76066 RepID=A0AAV7AV58_ENGPU|nr:hypothetical protein GDO81_015983 [Engystomops pustulosus]
MTQAAYAENSRVSAESAKGLQCTWERDISADSIINLDVPGLVYIELSLQRRAMSLTHVEIPLCNTLAV